MSDKPELPEAKGKGNVANMHSGRCVNDSYYRKFNIEYYDSYTDTKTGDEVFLDMYIPIVGFNAIARKIKAEIVEGDYIYFLGRLKFRYLENYAPEVFIHIEELEDIKLITDRR